LLINFFHLHLCAHVRLSVCIFSLLICITAVGILIYHKTLPFILDLQQNLWQRRLALQSST